MIIITLTS